MMSAFEAKRTAQENLSKIKAKHIERMVKEIERMITEAVELGKPMVSIRPGIEEIEEIAKRFEPSGYEFRCIMLNGKITHMFVVWDRERADKEISILCGREMFE